MTSVKHDGLMRVLWHFNQEMVYVNSPEALSEILVKNCYQFEKPDFAREFLAYVIGWALLTVEGDEHKTQRRNMLPAFSFRHIKDLYPVFWAKSCESTAAMTAECARLRSSAGEGGAVDMEIASWSTRAGLDIIGLAGTGIDFGAIKNPDNPLAQSYYVLNPSAADFVLLGLQAMLPSRLVQMLPIPRTRHVAAAAAHLRGVCRDLIAAKKAKLDNNEEAGFDILSVALASRLFTEDNLVDQMMTFLSAGHETTAAALVWSIYLLSRFPDKQKRLRDEVRQRLPSVDAADPRVTSADIDGMPYLNAVCSEVLRTWSPVAQTIRVSNCDTTVQGHFIPRDTLLVLPIWAINTDPRLWGPDAHEFKPERWLAPDQGGTSETNAASGGATSNYAFMTFIHGPHSCIGGNFSKSELACLLAAWVGRFSFELKDKSLLDERNMPVNPSVVAKPIGGLHMMVSVVDGW